MIRHCEEGTCSFRRSNPRFIEEIASGKNKVALAMTEVAR